MLVPHSVRRDFEPALGHLSNAGYLLSFYIANDMVLAPTPTTLMGQLKYAYTASKPRLIVDNATQHLLTLSRHRMSRCLVYAGPHSFFCHDSFCTRCKCFLRRSSVAPRVTSDPHWSGLSLAAYSAAAAFNVSENPTVRRALESLICLKEVASPSSSATPPAGRVVGFSRHTNSRTPHPSCYKAKRDWFCLNMARFFVALRCEFFIDNYPASDTASVTNTDACL